MATAPVVDLHTHHARCGHARGTLEEVARQARARGVDVLGWSDHAPLFAHAEDHPQPGVQMARSEWSAYLAEADAVRDELAREGLGLDLRIGIEADYLPSTQEAYRQALADPRLDYVLGSVHETRGWHVYKPRTWADLSDPDVFHRAYWGALREAAASGLFDVLSHLDAIRALAPAPHADLGADITATLDAIAAHDVAVEINASGLRKSDAFFPAPHLIEELVARGVPLTFGSDAHRFEELGAGFHDAAQLLRSLGRTELVTFRQRRRAWVPLP